MPWKETKDDQAIALYKQNGKHFVLFFASGTPPWCPDCRDAQPHLESVFKADDAPVLHVVRVGEREQWKTPSNKWRAEPYRIGEIPTLVRLEDVSTAPV
jgi:thiol-disulfide isomerase/thioredoxin